MIIIKNNLKKFSVDTEQYKSQAQSILDYLGYFDFDLGIWLTTNKTIRTYNKTYRGKDKATDVLSFPFHQIEAGQQIIPTCNDDKNIGDMLISVEFVQKAAQDLGTTFEKRMNRMLVHSICHLLGYDHIEDEDFKIMISLEKEVAQATGLDCSWE